MLDDVWGVVDLVVDSNFPDLRRNANINGKGGMVLQIPRERKSDGDINTRFYVSFPQTTTGGAESVQANTETQEEHEAKQRAHRATITIDRILGKVQEAMEPYYFGQKEGTDIEWWAVYQVGQRVASPFAVKDSSGHQRVFLVGDACHTHSPKIGQGMNVSMMDAFDLSWKLAHTLFGLTDNGTQLLETYASERRGHALNLIDMDKRWYKSRYGKSQAGGLGTEAHQMAIRAEVLKFVSGTAIEYEAGTMLVDERVTSDDADSVARYSAGTLREGRRIEDAIVQRYADGRRVHLHDEIESDGRYGVVVWTSKDLLEKKGTSQKVLRGLFEVVLRQLLAGLVKVFILHNLEHLSFEWSDLPECLKIQAETRLYRADNEIYRQFGIDSQQGGVCIVRPDVYVGTIADLTDDTGGLQKVEAYLKRCLSMVV